MAYLGTTSTAPNPPILLHGGMGSTGGQLRAVWLYRSTHVQAAVSSTGFFKDGLALGMKVGHVVMCVHSTAYTTFIANVAVVTSTGAGLTSGLIVSSAS